MRGDIHEGHVVVVVQRNDRPVSLGELLKCAGNGSTEFGPLQLCIGVVCGQVIGERAGVEKKSYSKPGYCRDELLERISALLLERFDAIDDRRYMIPSTVTLRQTFAQISQTIEYGSANSVASVALKLYPAVGIESVHGLQQSDQRILNTVGPDIAKEPYPHEDVAGHHASPG